MTQQNDMDAFLWRTLEGALGAEKAAYLRTAPLSTIVTRKIAAEYPGQETPELTWPHAVRHIGEKHAFAKARWRMVEQGIESLKTLAEEGIYKRAALLPRGTLQRKIAARERILYTHATASGDEQVRIASVLGEYDRQLLEYLGPERAKLASKAGLLGDLGEGLKSTYKAVKSDPVGKGALTAAGAAVPATAAGMYLTNNAEQKAKDMIPGAAAMVGGSSLLGNLVGGLGQGLVS